MIAAHSYCVSFDSSNFEKSQHKDIFLSSIWVQTFKFAIFKGQTPKNCLFHWNELNHKKLIILKLTQFNWVSILFTSQNSSYDEIQILKISSKSELVTLHLNRERKQHYDDLFMNLKQKQTLVQHLVIWMPLCMACILDKRQLSNFCYKVFVLYVKLYKCVRVRHTYNDC